MAATARLPTAASSLRIGSSLPSQSCWMLVRDPSAPLPARQTGQTPARSRAFQLRHERLSCQLLEVPDVDFVAVFSCAVIERVNDPCSLTKRWRPADVALGATRAKVGEGSGRRTRRPTPAADISNRSQ